MTPMGNPRAEAIFQASGLPNTDKVRRAIKADARYMMNHLNVRYSDAVSSACSNYPNLASPIALGILSDASEYAAPDTQHPCQSVIDDGGEFVPCRRTDTRHHGVGVWLCPEHSNTHRRHG